MHRLILAAAALVAAAVLVPAPAAADTEQPWGCREYMYVADYHWYYVCVDPKGGLCAVYFKERHGMTWSESCLVETDAAGVDTVAPSPVCVPTNLGGMDYHSEACVNPGDRKCLVSNGTWSQDVYTVKCYGSPY